MQKTSLVSCAFSAVAPGVCIRECSPCLCRKAVLDVELQKKQAESALEFERERYRSLEEAFQGQAQEVEGVRRRNLELAHSVTEFQRQLRQADQARQDAQDQARERDMKVSNQGGPPQKELLARLTPFVQYSGATWNSVSGTKGGCDAPSH
jgi:septal ring factor EnvC (AmiA/AmiB activator)